MDHDRAVEIQATERYLLGQMEAEERDAFEDHFFTCTLCAEEVRSASRFREAARHVARDFEPVRQERRRFAWWRFPMLAPVAVSTLLLGAVVYQAGFQIPALKRQLNGGRSITAVSLREITRGGASIPVIPAGEGLFSVYFDLPAGASGPAYLCTITNAAGKVVETIPTSAPRHGEPVNLLLSRNLYPSGEYKLAVRAADASDSAKVISEFQFKL